MEMFENKKMMRKYKKEAVNKQKEDNVILAKGLMMNVNDWETGRNLNTFVAGKDVEEMNECFVIPNLLQSNTSFVVTDPCGHMLNATRTFFENAGYEIKVLNLIDIKNSNH